MDHIQINKLLVLFKTKHIKELEVSLLTIF
jgi:hypothetical protein